MRAFTKKTAIRRDTSAGRGLGEDSEESIVGESPAVPIGQGLNDNHYCYYYYYYHYYNPAN